MCKYQKQITFTPKQFQMEAAGFENTMNKIFKGSQKTWHSSLKSAINILALVIGIAV